MPCYRCGARPVDPDRGPSPWKRGVRNDRQVLICPDCQSGRDWAAELDRCRTCTSVRLVRRLGEVECRDCGQVREAESTVPVQGTGASETGASETGASEEVTGLSEEVARALERVLGRSRALQ
jgi:hypothetical protein